MEEPRPLKRKLKSWQMGNVCERVAKRKEVKGGESVQVLVSTRQPVSFHTSTESASKPDAGVLKARHTE